MRESPLDKPGRSNLPKAYAQSAAIVDEIGRRSHALREDAAACASSRRQMEIAGELWQLAREVHHNCQPAGGRCSNTWSSD
jgi:hypothetical protein